MRDRKGGGIPSSRRKILAPLCPEKNSLSNFVDFLKSRERPITEGEEEEEVGFCPQVTGMSFLSTLPGKLTSRTRTFFHLVLAPESRFQNRSPTAPTSAIFFHPTCPRLLLRLRLARLR